MAQKLSERVREVQERRARDEALEAERRRLEAAASPPQLELLPQATMPAVNPLVAAALKRIERAHQSAPVADTRSTRAAAAMALPTHPCERRAILTKHRDLSSTSRRIRGDISDH